MATLKEIEKAVAALSLTEKAQLLHSLAQDVGDAFPGVETRPDVCGGEACIIRTRIPVWILEQARRLGASDAEILRSYPTLRASDLTSARTYVQSHQDEVDRQIRENEAA